MGLALVWLAVLLLFDVRRGRRFAAPARTARTGRGGNGRWCAWRLPLGHRDDHRLHQSQHAALLHSGADGRTPTWNLLGDGVRHGGDDAGQRLAGALRHPAAVAGCTPRAGGRNFARYSETAGRRVRSRTGGSGGGAGRRRSAAHDFLQPGVCRPLRCFHAADDGDRDSLRRVGVHQRDHVRALLRDPSAAVRGCGGANALACAMWSRSSGWRAAPWR